MLDVADSVRDPAVAPVHSVGRANLALYRRWLDVQDRDPEYRSGEQRLAGVLAELQEHDGLSYLFISHDLAVVRRVAHRTGVLRDGRLRELRPTAELFSDPQDDYTRELLAAIAGRRAGVVS